VGFPSGIDAPLLSAPRGDREASAKFDFARAAIGDRWLILAPQAGGNEGRTKLFVWRADKFRFSRGAVSVYDFVDYDNCSAARQAGVLRDTNPFGANCLRSFHVEPLKGP
jgi:hypothetical protein